jgi:hypothetical protein
MYLSELDAQGSVPGICKECFHCYININCVCGICPANDDTVAANF